MLGRVISCAAARSLIASSSSSVGTTAVPAPQVATASCANLDVPRAEAQLADEQTTQKTESQLLSMSLAQRLEVRADEFGKPCRVYI